MSHRSGIQKMMLRKKLSSVEKKVFQQGASEAVHFEALGSSNYFCTYHEATNGFVSWIGLHNTTAR